MGGVYLQNLSDLPSLTSLYSDALTSVEANVMTYIGIAVPVALAITGTFVAIKLGIKFFKSIVSG